jgi:hypothetical protein
MIAACIFDLRLDDPSAGVDGTPETMHRLIETLRSVRVLDIAVVMRGDLARTMGSGFPQDVHVEEAENPQEFHRIIQNNPLAGRADESHGLMLVPLTNASITREHIVRMLQRFWTSGKNIIVMTDNGGPGYPVIIASSLLSQMVFTDRDPLLTTIRTAASDDVAEVNVINNY